MEIIINRIWFPEQDTDFDLQVDFDLKHPLMNKVWEFSLTSCIYDNVQYNFSSGEGPEEFGESLDYISEHKTEIIERLISLTELYPDQKFEKVEKPYVLKRLKAFRLASLFD
ncbi:hypothetical protein [Bacillus sp. EB01]|uniref:hypothetical protein n=1 Tax=Bacillus sp. EB01 TaxID=1347086 RepID=UPI0005C58002|nr:hypothetical protein [Bacillus sp. EB01]